MRNRQIIWGFLFTLLISFIMTDNGYAWNFKEHMEIGINSYAKACDDLNNDFATDTKYQLACTKIEGQYYYAEIYGQLCAIAADHLSSPEEFRNKFSGRTIASFTDMGNIAMQNSCNFSKALTHLSL